MIIKRTLRAGLLLAGLLLLPIVFSQPSRGAPLVVVCYGDSITQNRLGYEYPVLLQAAYPSWVIHNEGHAAWQSEAITAQVEATAPSYQADLVLVLMGVNDVQWIAGLCWACGWDHANFPAEFSRAAYAARLERIVTAVLAANAGAQVYFLLESPMTRDFTTFPWPNMIPQPPTLHWTKNCHTYYQQGYDQQITALAAVEPAVYAVDLLTPILANWSAYAAVHGWAGTEADTKWSLTEEEQAFNQALNNYMLDPQGLHPTARGHQLILAAIEAVLDPPPVTTSTTTTTSNSTEPITVTLTLTETETVTETAWLTTTYTTTTVPPMTNITVVLTCPVCGGA